MWFNLGLSLRSNWEFGKFLLFHSFRAGAYKVEKAGSADLDANLTSLDSYHFQTATDWERNKVKLAPPDLTLHGTLANLTIQPPYGITANPAERHWRR
jgi:hypothetical protein